MHKPVILIADDDDSLLRLFTIRCKALGLEVRTAADGMMALTSIHKDPPDIVLLDINMPAGNGLGVLEMLKTDRRLGKISVIVYSGESSEEIINRCKSLRAHFVKKSPDAWTILKPILQQLIVARRSAA